MHPVCDRTKQLAQASQVTCTDIKGKKEEGRTPIAVNQAQGA